MHLKHKLKSTCGHENGFRATDTNAPAARRTGNGDTKRKAPAAKGAGNTNNKNTGDREYVLLFDEHDKHGGHEDVFDERKKHTQAVTKEPAATPTPVANRVCLIRTLNYRTIRY